MAFQLLNKHKNADTIYRTPGESGRYFRGDTAEVFWSLLPDDLKEYFNPRLLMSYSNAFVNDVTRFVREWNRKNPIHGPREDPGYDD